MEPENSRRVAFIHEAGVMGEKLLAGWELPRYDNSAMDGFAVRSVDCRVGAELEIVDTGVAGSNPECGVSPGKTVRIMSGAVIPRGADAVIPVERTEIVGNRARLQKKVLAGDHIRRQGEDFANRSPALAAAVNSPGVKK